MNHKWLLFVVLLAGQAMSGAWAAPTEDALFSPGYFWMWNAPLDATCLNGQLEVMASNGLQAVCAHPFPKDFRHGAFSSEMAPDYLTDGYLKAFAGAVRKAGDLGMHMWLYDEGGWPSGGACGKVAASDPEGRFQFRLIGRDDTGKIRVSRKPYGSSRDPYVSVVEPGATERFLQLTHEAYYRTIPEAFGTTIRLAFMDEPHAPRSKGGGLGWTSDFAEVFKAKKGYDILPYVPDLIDGKHGSDESVAAVRLDYCDVMADLFCERFLLPIRDWCRAHRILSGGHLDGEDRPERTFNYAHGSLLRSLRAMDVPGVDVIWRQLYPGGSYPRVTAPFPRYASSAMRQNGGKYALSETFGIFGDSVSPAQMKWLIDYQMVRGINVFVFGYWALSNARQWMLLFEPHSGPVVPYWEMEGPFFRYIRETAKFLSHGRPAVETAVLYNTRAFWAGGMDSEIAARAQYAVAATLDNANTDFDFVDDESIAAAEVTADGLKVGAMTYRTVVLPTVKWLRPSALQKLSSFTAEGGNVVGLEDLAKVPRTCRVTGAGAEDIRVTKRVDGERTIYFIVNEKEWEREVSITFPEKGPVARWDWESGRLYNVPLWANGSFKNYFEGAGSKMFVVGGELGVEEPVYEGEEISIESGWTLRKLVSHEAGETDFVVRTCADLPQATALGDWRALMGTAFSGKAVYRVTFNSPRAGLARLDLGKVCWCASVRLNGRTVGTKFFGPYVFEVELVKGENILEVTVANLLANQISDPLVRTRLAKRYPPSDNYERRQSQYDRENNESGLFGPVTVRLK